MNIKKKKYIFLPKLELKHLLFLAFFIVTCVKKGFQIKFELDQKVSIEFIKLYIYDFGDFLSIIPLLIMKKRMKNEKDISNKNQKPAMTRITSVNSQGFLPNRVKKKSNFALYRNIFLFTIVDFTAQISSVIFYIVQNEQKLVVGRANLNSTLIFSILAVIIFSYFFLHTNFYRHHVFSLVINLICVIILTAIDLTKIFEAGGNVSTSIIYLFVRIFSESLYSLEDVIAKIIFFYYFYSTFGLLVSKSIIHFFYLIIFNIPFIFIKLGNNEGDQYIVFSKVAEDLKNKKNIVIFSIYIITSFFYNNLYLKIIDVFSPNHLAIGKIFENFGVFIIDLIVNGVDSEENLIIRFIIFIVLILSSFIFNEYLVINICGLSKNTKLFLDYEAEKDILSSEINEGERASDAIEITTYIVHSEEGAD